MIQIFYPLEQNKDIIVNLFGSDFMKDSIDDRLSVDASLEANQLLANYLYGYEIAEMLRNRQIDKLNERFNQLKTKYVDSKQIPLNVNFEKLGLVLIRPENIGLVEKYINFLESKNLSVIYKKKVILDFENYWLLYHHGLICYDAMHDFPTRTLNYINKECCLLLVYSTEKKNFPVADYLMSMKGKQGIEKNGTLRGDIAYNALKKCVTNDGMHFTENYYNILFDPIGMCRILVRNQIDSDHSHDMVDLKLLYYVGQAVHIPDSREILDDFRVLFTDNDIDYVEQKIKALRK